MLVHSVTVQPTHVRPRLGSEFSKSIIMLLQDLPRHTAPSEATAGCTRVIFSLLSNIPRSSTPAPMARLVAKLPGMQEPGSLLAVLLTTPLFTYLRMVT